MSASPLSLAHETEPGAATVGAISKGLYEHGAKFFPGADWTPRYVVARDAAGAIGAGVRFLMPMEWLFVEWVWVAERYRRSGEGARLLKAAEDEARRAGCRGAYLDTFSFQAPGFYAKLGYEEFGRIADFPRGYDRIWLMKRF